MGAGAVCSVYTLITHVCLIFPNIIVNLTIWNLEYSRDHKSIGCYHQLYMITSGFSERIFFIIFFFSCVASMIVESNNPTTLI